jgi:hypothetical protein
MYDLLMIAIDWYGPYKSVNAARTAGQNAGVADFLYVAFSNDGEDRGYAGLSSNIAQRLTDRHHIIGGFADNELDIWIGLIASQSVAGRRPGGGYALHSASLEIAEHMIAYFLELTENDRKRRAPPRSSAAVFNRWFRPTDPFERRVHRPRSFWPDFIEFEADNCEAHRVSFGKPTERMDRERVLSIARRD